MTRLNDLIIGAAILIMLAVGAALGLRHYGHEQYDAGYAAAVAVGEKSRQAEADRNREAENDLRAQLAAQDTTARQKEQEYAKNLDAVQRRVRAGTDSLRCPAASPLQPGATTEDRPAAASAAVDGQGPVIVPDAAADLLGIAADAAGLVRRYERVVERFEACRALNEVP